jgi:predicted DNA-binding protein (MmcQ/YjbR family)
MVPSSVEWRVQRALCSRPKHRRSAKHVAAFRELQQPEVAPSFSMDRAHWSTTEQAAALAQQRRLDQVAQVQRAG